MLNRCAKSQSAHYQENKTKNILMKSRHHWDGDHIKGPRFNKGK